MIFAGIDPGSESYAIAFVDELGRLIKYYEIPTELIINGSISIVKYIADLRPKLVALPSGHGLPFYKISNIQDKEIFLLTLADPQKTGPLHNFIRAARVLNGVTLPSVVELESVPEYRKINIIDMGTADKLASTFFYRTFFDSFVLVEAGRHFYSIIVVIDGKVIDGFGGTVIPGPVAPGALDGEVAYLLSKYSKITKDTIYTNGNKKRAIEIIKIISEWYSTKYDIPIIISGKDKYNIDFGEKFEFKFKESATGASYIANAICGGIYRKYIDMLKSSNIPISYVRLKGWEEIISLIKTL